MPRHGLIVGISGRAGAGKSTLAQALIAASGGAVVAFADSLRDVVQAAFGSRYETQEAKAARDDFWAPRLGPKWADGRSILQRVGSDLFRAHVHPDFWVFHLERRLAAMPPQPLIAVPDVRFDNEARWVAAQGGLVVRIAREDAAVGASAEHVSEHGIDRQHLDLDFVSPSVAVTQTLAQEVLDYARRRAERRARPG
jgi:hypothetical protein